MANAYEAYGCDASSGPSDVAGVAERAVGPYVWRAVGPADGDVAAADGDWPEVVPVAREPGALLPRCDQP
jgi:hypothetical protein